MLVMQSVAVLTSCGKDDDYKDVELKDPTEYFVPADSDTTQTAQLRRAFKAEEGSYLLFNDTLQHNLIGKDANGEDVYFTELLDINYSTMSSSASSYANTYYYLTTYARQQQAVEYVKTYINSHLSLNLRPFCYLLVNRITARTSSGATSSPQAAYGERCIALAMKDVRNQTTTAGFNRVAKQHLVIIVGSVANNNPSYLTDFKAVSQDYYGASPAAGVNINEEGKKLGFVEVPNLYYPDYSKDVDAYASLVIAYSEETIATRYAAYPNIIKKAKLFREALTKMGYVF